MAPITKTTKASSGKTRSSSQMHIKKVKGENFYRNAKAVNRLKMLNSGKPTYDRDGKIVKAAAFQKGEEETSMGRVQPDRRWFGNTRVISQTALDHFRTSLSNRVNNPYSVLLRRKNLPMALLDDAANPNFRKRSHIVETEPFENTFGPKAQRKRPRLDVNSFEELSQAVNKDVESVTPAVGSAVSQQEADMSTHADRIEPIYSKGTSRRIYGELYKVIDSSDVILHILDARDPLGTICNSVLEYVRKEKAHKQVVLILNKCDLVPAWVTARYIAHLTPQYPTLAFHASPNHSFGKGALIALLRQFSQLHSDKKQISIGLIGYPNVGKSSVINTLKKSKVCNVAPVPGETKVWQYITLTRRIYLIDCPGIVPSSASSDSTTATVLKGVVRVEALPTPSEHIPILLERVRPIYLSRTYGIPLPKSDVLDVEPRFDADDFLDKLARMKGRLLKGGEPDIEGVAKIVLSDWVRGRIPYFVEPPARPAKAPDVKGNAKADLQVDAPRNASGLGIPQKLKGIIQKNTFMGEDVRDVEGEDHGQDDHEDEQEFRGFGDDAIDPDYGEEGSEISADQELQWGDVFSEDDDRVDATAPPRQKVVGEVREEDEHDEEAKKEGPKTKRMTTNKRKPTNFYTNANVKNKNRAKPKLLSAKARSRGGKK